MPIKVVFCSSSSISIPLLEALHKDSRYQILALICPPDRPVGRNLELKKQELKEIGERLGIKVYQSESLKVEQNLLEGVKGMQPDFLLTFSFGQMLNSDWLQLGRLGAFNIHPSLLPKYRGASPIVASVLNGDSETGISVYKMTEKMDAGPILSQDIFPIPPNSTTGFLEQDLADFAAQTVPNALATYYDNPERQLLEQNEMEASYCHKLTKQDGFVDFKETAEKIYRKFLAYSPWPGLWTTFKGKRIKLLSLSVVDLALAPGEISCENKKLYLGTPDGALEIKQVQMESKPVVYCESFILGHPDACHSSWPS